ncbi:MAG: HAD-IG family 5'-nucleotidase [Candidatus Riflebacteria bacterium]|nr:HAD-IG family 5'-nucleotidase [Candidatus Riflebacteria bacterium]
MAHQPMVGAENRVFVNRTLNFNNIKMIGFDMDYTVATYNVPNLEGKAFEIVRERLISEKGYPPEIRALQFDPNFIIRGLIIDHERGNFLKVNRYGYVKKATHGTRPLTIDEQKRIYDTRGIDLTDPRFYIIHTLFSLAEGCLFARLVDWFEQERRPVSFPALFKDIRGMIDDTHQDGSLKGFVVREPQKYLIQDRKAVEALKKFRHYGKKLALITNSDFEYSQAVMHYCFDPFLPKSNWHNLFHIVIVTSNKPNFFLHSQKFLRVDPKTGLLSNFHGPLELGGIYQGGNARTFERDLGLQPSEILYLGDHILGDVITLKKTTGWRTGLVVQELATEVPALELNRDLQRQINELMVEKDSLENEVYEIKEELWDKRENRPPALEKKRDQLRERIAVIDEKLTALIGEEQRRYNPFWGEVMRSGNEESRFATIVERYACIYMASIGNLSYYSPFKYFRPPRRYLAHDPLPLALSETLFQPAPGEGKGKRKGKDSPRSPLSQPLGLGPISQGTPLPRSGQVRKPDPARQPSLPRQPEPTPKPGPERKPSRPAGRPTNRPPRGQRRQRQA